MADDDWENEAKTGEVKSEAPKSGGFGSGGGGFGSAAASTGFGGSSGFGGKHLLDFVSNLEVLFI